MPPPNAAVWLLGALVGVLCLVVLGAFFWLVARRWCRVRIQPVGGMGVPQDFRRSMAPWLSRLGHFGFGPAIARRMESPEWADGYRWFLCHPQERVFATLDRTLALGSGRPKVRLTFYTASADGTLTATLDRAVLDPLPAYWSAAGRRFRTVESQWKEHLLRVEELEDRILPAMEKLPALLDADEEARHHALLASGERRHTLAGPDVLRWKWSALPGGFLRSFFDLLALRHAGSYRRWDVPTSVGEEETPASGPTMEQAVEQDLQRYKRVSRVTRSPGDHYRRILFQITLIALMVGVFGREAPGRTAITVAALMILHEFGHWLPMRIFGYRGVARIFVPFAGSTQGARKPLATEWQSLVVLFSGPLPGLIAGLAVMLAAQISGDTPVWLSDAAGLAVILNGLQLLPVLPLDGGRILDLLVFRDLPWARPLFTFCSATVIWLAAFALKSPALKIVAAGISAALVLDIRNMAIIRRARKFDWAGDLSDENDALRRIFRGIREEGKGYFVGSRGWNRRIDALMDEAMRRRPRMFTRFSGLSFYAAICVLPLSIVILLMSVPLLRMPAALVDKPDQSVEFRSAFPRTEEQAKDPVAVSALRELTRRAASGFGPLPDLANPGVRAELMDRVLPVITARLDRLDWEDVGMERRRGAVDAGVLGMWIDAQVVQMERAAMDGRSAETLRRAEVMLHAFAKLEPVPHLSDRRTLWSAESRTLQIVERESASGRLDPAALERLDGRLNLLNRSAVPEVENFLLVDEWVAGERQRTHAMRSGATGFDVRFWRDIRPRLHRLVEMLDAGEKPLTPASVATARLWKKTRRVGELPPKLAERVSVAAGEAALIQDFCEGHRLISWRRQCAISALRLEVHRRKTGSFPSRYHHRIPGGGALELVTRGGPLLRLIDQRTELERMIPPWLVTADGRDLPALPRIHHECPLHGAPEAPSLSAR